ncbi:MAG: nitrogen regulation protein NR(II) [Gammaproteobacteria bacterium]
MTALQPTFEADVRQRVALTNWSALRYFNLYRIVIAGLFAALSTSGKMPPNLSALDAQLFSASAVVYAAGAVVWQFLIEQRTFHYRVLVYGQSLLDILAITLLMHAAGGVTSGLGMLLVVAVAGTCLLASGRAGVFFAALASIAFLGETVFGTFYLGYSSANYTQAGLLGAACFGTAILASVLAERARRGETLAALRAIDIQNLSLLNEHIVRRMRAGIIALDGHGQVVLMNDAANEHLGRTGTATGTPLDSLSPLLGRAYRAWLSTGQNPVNALNEGSHVSTLASFTELSSGPGASGTLVFLEDAAETRQRAQQLKLASLGRLTASIAHEIRNPLGAISHAGQLLSESDGLVAEDRRLIEIMLQHTRRVNTIIENVLTLGRRRDTVSESFALQPWLSSFREEVIQRAALEPVDVVIEPLADDIVVRMDKGQLQQVMWNLCENALRYARTTPRLRFQAAVGGNGRPHVDVVDSGPGLDPAIADRLFEPFATSEPAGTGLGLYIARELCESNQATLQLVPGAGGCRFRITFAHPHRQQRLGDL